MLKISFESVQKVRFSNKYFVFVYGLILGSVLTVAIIKLPLEQFLPAEEIVQPKEETDFRPLENVDLPLNDRIKSRIRYFLQPNRLADLLQSYKRSGKYVPMISAIFEEYNLPQTLIYLPVLESGFIPNNRSRVGAVGLWQIMPATATDHGLKYNRWIDERKDPEKSTIVAAEYLQFLYNKFRDWDLALAAYNYGYAKLLRRLKREKTFDFWTLRHIPRETYHFVPNLYAILHILSHPEKYGVHLPQPQKPVEYESVDIEATFSIDQIARLANVAPSIIKRYNPALSANIAPSGKYSIKVPVGVKEHFLEEFKKTPLERVEITYTTYRVRRGDSLYKIAKKFGTTVNAIRADNNLRSRHWIKAGRKLRIAVVSVIQPSVVKDRSEAVSQPELAGTENKLKFIYRVERNELSLNTLARYYAVSVDNIKVWNPWISRDRLAIGEEVNILKPRKSVTFHRVRKGESLWRLSRKYHTSVSSLKRWNQIWSSRIYPGDRLIVGVG